MAMENARNYTHAAQAEMFKSIGHPIRLQIVKCLVKGERSVLDIVSAVGAEQSNVSRHLAILKQAGVLVCRRSGLKMYYRLAFPAFAEGLKVVLSQIAEAVQRGVAIRMGSAEKASQGPPPVSELN